jgi:hypothetical protein
MVLPPPEYEGAQSGLLNPHKWIHGPYGWVMGDQGKRPEHQALGCDSMQGFLLGYPLSPTLVEQTFANHDLAVVGRGLARERPPAGA